MTVAFELEGQAFTALNGGPVFQFNEAISFQVHCETQEEVDYYWEKLSAGGDAGAQQCGWLKDKYGVSCQVVLTVLLEMLHDPASEKSQRAMEAMLQMKKLDIERFKQAHAGACRRTPLKRGARCRVAVMTTAAPPANRSTQPADHPAATDGGEGAGGSSPCAMKPSAVKPGRKT